MGQHDWYRRTTWTEADQVEFAARHARSRGTWNKAQYLTIQAHYLQEVGGHEMLTAAIGLLDEYFEKYAEEHTLIASACLAKGECLESLGRNEEVIEMYRKSLQQQRDFPNWRCPTYLRFGQLIVRLKMRELYPEVLAVLEESKDNVLFPRDKYLLSMVYAVIMDDLGRRTEAAQAAELAIEAANETESSFRYDKEFGVVTNPDEAIQMRLTEIVKKQRLFG